MGRLFIIIGLLIAGAGLLMTLGFPIGRLPGDFSFRRGELLFLLSPDDVDSGQLVPKRTGRRHRLGYRKMGILPAAPRIRRALLEDGRTHHTAH